MAEQQHGTKTWIILLRGVMPTGRNKVPMAELRSALEAAGLNEVRTYIQSGNVIVSCGLPRRALEALVHDVIAEHFGGDIVVLAREASRFKHILARNPFAGEDTARLYFTLLDDKPKPAALETFLAPGYLPDRIEVIDDVAYILCATSYSDLKINNNFIERKLGVSASTRVYNTIARLVELTEAGPDAAR